MSGLLSKLFGRNTPGKVKVSPISTASLRTAHPQEMTNEEIRERVSQYVIRTQGDQKPEVQEFVRRQMFFDLKYRCGARGRCFKGAGRCTFPRCFTMRPSIKGGEVLSEKGQIEEALMSAQDVPDEIRALVELSAKDENCSAIADAVTNQIEAHLKPFYATQDDGSKKLDCSGADDREVGHIIILAVWRAVLLVNDGKDDQAVQGLLDLAAVLAREHRGALFSSAAGWATLHDMEVRFYKQHLAIFPDLAQELCDPKIGERPDDLLERVLRAAGSDDAIIRQIAFEVFSKEISAIVARAQNAQEHSDDVEDPMGTSVVIDSINVYHSRIGGQFWDDFMNLSMMPPLVADKNDPSANAAGGAGGKNEAPQMLPRHVMDALGRSMLLHHCASSYGALPGTDAAIEGDKVNNEDMMRQKAILNRMAELVNIVKNATNIANAGGAPPKK
jgi:hypothetical protein